MLRCQHCARCAAPAGLGAGLTPLPCSRLGESEKPNEKGANNEIMGKTIKCTKSKRPAAGRRSAAPGGAARGHGHSLGEQHRPYGQRPRVGLAPSERGPHAQRSPRGAELRGPPPFLPFGTKRVPLPLRDAGFPVAARVLPFAYSRLAEGPRPRPVSPGAVRGEARCPRTGLCPFPAPSVPPTRRELNGMRPLLPKQEEAARSLPGSSRRPHTLGGEGGGLTCIKNVHRGRPYVPVCLRGCHTDIGLLKPGVGSGFANAVTKKIWELMRSRMTFVVLSFQCLPSCDGCCAALLIITYHILHI